jgi:SAM-dependent methyltransferase
MRGRRQLMAIGRGRADSATQLVPVTAENFDEAGYLAANPDVRQAVESGFFESGRRHFDIHGRDEGRSLLIIDQGDRRLPAPVAGWLDARRQAARSRAELEARLYDQEVLTNQLQHVLELMHGIAPPPPKHLQVRVVGSYNGDFIRSGFTSTYPQLTRVLASAGRSLADFGSILDFGCGCGRSIFALSRLLPDAALHGTDIDEEAIAWLRDHCGEMATYSVCPPDPPTVHGDDTFDFAFGISVMTHLPEDMQSAWLAELSRIVRPGGYVMLTTHGEHHYRSVLDATQLAALEENGFLYVESGYGSSVSLPDFYETAFHTHDYIRREWIRFFEVVDVQPPAAREHQDTVLLRVRD